MRISYLGADFIVYRAILARFLLVAPALSGRKVRSLGQIPRTTPPARRHRRPSPPEPAVLVRALARRGGGCVRHD
jgi:hypothetical protein